MTMAIIQATLGERAALDLTPGAMAFPNLSDPISPLTEEKRRGCHLGVAVCAYLRMPIHAGH